MSLSALSMTTTRHAATVGRVAARVMMSRTESTEMDSSCGWMNTRSVWLCCSSTWRHAAHSPQPSGRPSSTPVHISAAARSSAAYERPEPGGPVNSHECDIARGS